MTITALPPTTIRLLNSVQVLTTPVSLIKELIDNSLDAKASSIDILVSPNTLDKVEVRDNGHGIQLEDLDALARHGHTSKLRSFEELKLLGGVTLGFRGEALASAVQLGEVTITTKTEGESVGTTVKLKITGGIDHQTRTSHPVGTTVSVKNFMAKLPVRKKTFEKEAIKTMAKIHRLLQAYALARPSIRLSLKVSKGGKWPWSFIPHPSGDIREAVLQAINRDTALQCVETTMQSEEGEQTSSLALADKPKHGRHREQFAIDAFLPSPHADPSKIGGGQFLSIDSRPVSHEKGTMKKIVTIFKKYIRGSFNNKDDKVKFPFIRLNIKCPAASYDANVEPAKDDVLFGNEDLVLETVERLFKAIYADCFVFSTPASKALANSGDNLEQALVPDSVTQPGVNGQLFTIAASTEAQSHITQSPRNQHESPRGDELMVAENSYTDEVSNSKQSKWECDISEDFTVEAEGYKANRNRYNHNKEGRVHSIGKMQPEKGAHLNPWIISKKTHQSTQESTATASNTNSIILGSHRSRDLDKDNLSISASRDQQSSHNNNTTVSRLRRSVTPPQPPNSQLWSSLPKLSNRQQLLIGDDSDILVTDMEQPYPPTRRRDFVTPRNIAQGSLLSPPQTQLSKVSSGVRASGPFVSPFRCGNNNIESGSLHQTKLLQHLQPSRTHVRDQQDISANSDLDWAMDFEKRKEEATRRRRIEVGNLKIPDNEPVTSKETYSSPHKNRYLAATSNLKDGQLSFHRSTQERTKKPLQTMLSNDDQRVHLMKRQESINSQTIPSGDAPQTMGAKSTWLLLETVPRESQIQQLTQPLPTTFGALQRISLLLAKDQPSMSTFTGLSIAPSHISEVSKSLHDVVIAWMKDEEFEIEYTLASLSNNILQRGG